MAAIVNSLFTSCAADAWGQTEGIVAAAAAARLDLFKKLLRFVFISSLLSGHRVETRQARPGGLRVPQQATTRAVIRSRLPVGVRKPKAFWPSRPITGREEPTSPAVAS